jgi:ABC-type sugar transport system substrate-binding protein
MAATVAQYPEKMGRTSVELADQLLKGAPVKFDDQTAREVFAPVQLITKENLPMDQ